MTYYKGTYKGTIEKLKGKTALLQFSTIPGHVRVQFDDTTLDKDATTLDDCFAHGWHYFLVSDFLIKETTND